MLQTWGCTMVKKAKAKSKPKVKKPKVKRYDLSRIALAAAKAMQVPEAFTQRGLSFDISGRPAGVFKAEAVRCDALG